MKMFSKLRILQAETETGVQGKGNGVIPHHCASKFLFMSVPMHLLFPCCERLFLHSRFCERRHTEHVQGKKLRKMMAASLAACVKLEI